MKRVDFWIEDWQASKLTELKGKGLSKSIIIRQSLKMFFSSEVLGVLLKTTTKEGDKDGNV